MSNSIKLASGKEIHDWMQANQPEYTEMTVTKLDDFLGENLEDASRKVPENGDYHSVEYTVFTPDGDPILTVVRVYIAPSGEEALQQYLFGPASQLTGKGITTVFTKLSSYFSYEMQEIEVSLLPDGEYCPH